MPLPGAPGDHQAQNAAALAAAGAALVLEDGALHRRDARRVLPSIALLEPARRDAAGRRGTPRAGATPRRAIAEVLLEARGRVTGLAPGTRVHVVGVGRRRA